jgi:hypothetical protein
MTQNFYMPSRLLLLLQFLNAHSRFQSKTRDCFYQKQLSPLDPQIDGSIQQNPPTINVLAKLEEKA